MTTKTTVCFPEKEVQQLVNQMTKGMGQEIKPENIVIEYITGTFDTDTGKNLEITFSVKSNATPAKN